MRYIHKKMEERLNCELSLGATGKEQDWEHELADGDRIEEFIREYHLSQRNDDRDFALVSLIVASFDDRLTERMRNIEGEYFEFFDKSINNLDLVYTTDEKVLWEEVKKILNSNLSLYDCVIRYWSCMDHDGDAFASTLFFRNLNF